MSLGYFIDIQGTLLSDKDKNPIEGSKEFLEHLKSKNIPYILVTNNTKQLSDELKKDLIQKGFKFEYFLDPLMVLKEHIKNSSIYPFGSQEFRTVLEKMDFTFSQNPDTILISSDHTLGAEDFSQMIEFLLDGAKLVAMHATSTYVKNSKRYAGVGAIAKMLCYATGIEAKVIGKPSKNFYNVALKSLQKQNPKLSFKDIVMISDDAIGDLCGAKELGIQTKLVLSGKCKSEEEISHIKDRVDGTYKNIGEIAKELR